MYSTLIQTTISPRASNVHSRKLQHLSQCVMALSSRSCIPHKVPHIQDHKTDIHKYVPGKCLSLSISCYFCPIFCDFPAVTAVNYLQVFFLQEMCSPLDLTALPCLNTSIQRSQTLLTQRHPTVLEARKEKNVFLKICVNSINIERSTILFFQSMINNINNISQYIFNLTFYF